MQNLPELARTYLESAEKTLSTPEYTALVGDVYRQMGTAEKIALVEVETQENIADLAQDQIDILEEQQQEVEDTGETLVSLKEAADAYHNAALDLERSGLEKQIEQHQDALTELQGIRSGVLDLSEALRNYRAAGGAGAPGLGGGGIGGGGAGGGNTGGTTGSLVSNALAYLNANPDVYDYYKAHAGTMGMSAVGWAQHHYQQWGQSEDRVWGSYAHGGIATGPESGYPVELHGKEAIIPLGQGSLPLVLKGGSGMEPLIREIRLLRQAVEQLGQSGDKNHFETQRALKTIRDKVIIFDTVGMPERKVS